MVDARFLSRTLVGLGMLAVLSMLLSPFGPSCEAEPDPALDPLLQDLQTIKVFHPPPSECPHFLGPIADMPADVCKMGT